MRWIGPSLLRRIVLTLLAAMTLAWAALVLKDYGAFKRDVQNLESLGRVTESLLASLDGFDLREARAAMVAADRVYNDLRHRAQPQAPGALLFRLSRADGALVYTSDASLPDLAPTSGAAPVAHQGLDHWLVVKQNTLWRLALWVPVLGDGAALVRIGLELLGYVLLALPLVLLPLLLAVWLGLRPLRLVSQGISQRAADDLTPLQEPTGYAELAPLVNAVNTLLDRARHQRQTEQAFVQDAAHELKTPLAVVAAQAHVLSTAQDEAQRQAALWALEKGVQRASHQVNQLLALSALEHPASQAPATLDLVALARDVLIDLEPLARHSGTRLALQSPERLLGLIDAGAFRLVLVNLVRNAIGHGRPDGAVEVVLAQEGGGLELRVSDDGPGIPPAERTRVWDRFYRGSEPRTSGSGLGLAIVARAAQRMGAQLRMEDGQAGLGLTVVLSWPKSPMP